MTHHRTIVLGAGAAGLMAAAHAGPDTLVIDHAKAPGEKIRISGGGRCNFTNLHCGPENFLSENPHFAKSALARYTQWDFIDLVARHGIPWHEKTRASHTLPCNVLPAGDRPQSPGGSHTLPCNVLPAGDCTQSPTGQLFCDTSAKDIIRMLLAEAAPAELRLNTAVTRVDHSGGLFTLNLSTGQTVSTDNLVIATGGKSIPKMGATGFAYDIARQFGHRVTETRAGLVPLTFGADELDWIRPLAGTALPARVTCGGASFDEALLFTHRGLSGPAILQISSYWRETQDITVNLLPDQDAFTALRAARAENGRRSLSTVLATLLPNRLAAHWAATHGLHGNIADYSDARLRAIAGTLHGWQLHPIGTEGYRTAEVTLGGVDTAGLDARSLQSRTVPGLYFIGECVDVTGWLGGYNFQWAWSSGWAAGRAISGG